VTVIVVAGWCLLGITLFAVAAYRTRRADIARGLTTVENYANDKKVRATWAHMPAPKERGNA
jgi:hypothetical protein